MFRLAHEDSVFDDPITCAATCFYLRVLIPDPATVGLSEVCKALLKLKSVMHLHVIYILVIRLLT